MGENSPALYQAASNSFRCSNLNTEFKVFHHMQLTIIWGGVGGGRRGAGILFAYLTEKNEDRLETKYKLR